MNWRISPLGEAALLAEAVGEEHEAANRAALAAAAALDAAPPPGLTAAVPGIASLLLCFEPERLSHAAAEALLRELLGGREGAGAPGEEAVSALAPSPSPLSRLITIPVRFGDDDGPDLDEVAGALGLAPSGVVTLLTATPLRVMMIGFAPGFPYLGPLPPVLQLPRRATPRQAVPAGSVAIAAGLAGIYPARLPGGWHLLGRTELQLFDAHADPPALLTPGDRVQFVAL
jgi:KipI family sensor histidine kinase inhibitor